MTWQKLKEKQPIVIKTLTNSIKKARLVHAYLLEGFKGTGKRAVAVQLAKTYFCQYRDGIDPCHQCSDCRRIESGNHPDVVYVVPEGLSIKKQQVADLIKEFSYRGVESIRKFFIIEQAEKMTAHAANSLLKFIEEPSQETIAVLTTENVYHMLDTIISRCQVLTFSPLSTGNMEKGLLEHSVSRPLAKSAAVLTQDFDGALTLCHDEWFATARNIVIKLMIGLSGQRDNPFFTIYEEYNKTFENTQQAELALDLMLFWYKDLLNVYLGEEENIVFIDQLDNLSKQVLHSSLRQITNGLSAVFAAKQRLGANVNHQFVIEQLVLRLQGGI